MPKRLQKSDREGDRELRRQIAARVVHLWELSGEDKTDFAARMGLTYNAFKEQLRRESFASHSLVRLAQDLELSLDYICCLSDEPTPPRRSDKRRTYWDMTG